jgi:hypothetical protein
VTKARSPLFEIAFVLVHFNHIASIIVNADHGISTQELDRRSEQRLLRRVDSSIRYTADFLPLTINASAGKRIVPLTKHFRAQTSSATSKSQMVAYG